MHSRLATILLPVLLLVLAGLPAQAAGLNDVIRALETPFKAETPDKQKISDYTADFFQEARIAALDRLQRARGRVSVRFEHRPGSRQVPTVMFHWEYDEPTRQEIVSDGKTLWVYLPENNQVIQSDVEMVSRSRETNPMTFLTGLGNLSRDFQISWAEPNRDVAGNYVLDLRPRRITALLNRMVIVVDRAAVGEASVGAATQSPAASTREPLSRGSDSRRTGPSAGEPAGQGSNAFFDDNFDPNRPITDSRSGTAPSGSLPEKASSFSSSSGRHQQAGGLVFPILSTTLYDPNGNSTTIEFSDLRVNRGLSAGEFRFIQPAGVEVIRPTGKEMGF